jgi:hypothetical protein
MNRSQRGDAGMDRCGMAGSYGGGDTTPAAGCGGSGPADEVADAFSAARPSRTDVVGLVGSLLDVIAVMQWRIEQLQAALDRRAVIEQAKGALMEREGVNVDVAFERLRRAARSTRQPIRQVATDVLAGGALPSVDGWRRSAVEGCGGPG